jgi:hypothetical protein
MTFAHVMGVPVEETALSLAPAGAAILTVAALVARAKLAEVAARVRGVSMGRAATRREPRRGAARGGR